MRHFQWKRFVTVFAMFTCFGMMSTGCSLTKLFTKKKRMSYAERRKAKRAAREKANAEARKTFSTWLTKGSCETAEKEFLKKYISLGKEARVKAGVKFAKCGNWKFVYTRLFASNRGWAIQQLEALEQAKLPIPAHKGLEKYISESSEPFSVRYGYHSLDFLRHAVDRSKQKKKYCKAFYQAAQKAPKIRNFQIRSKVRRYGIGFMPVGQCKQYKKFVGGLLASNWWIDRNLGCWALGKMGGRSDLRKISILASTDGYVDRKQSRRMRRPVYPVRNTCRAAMGQIRVRN